MRLALALISAAACLLGGVSLAEEPIVIKFSHVVAPDTPKGQAAERFKQLAEQYTGGKVKVEIYPNSQLYKDKEELESLQLGSVQMLAPSLAKFGPLGAKEFEAFDLPCLFPDRAGLHRVTDGKIGAELLKKLESRGIVGLDYWDNGFKIFSANSPIKTVADFKGLKMRVQSSKVLEAQMRALGAIPQSMPFSEVYQGLQTGVVDGTENPPSNMYTQKMFEVQKYANVSRHGYLGYAVIVNKKFWDGLPEGIRTQLSKAMTEATAYNNEIAQKDNDDALAAMKASGKTDFFTPTVEERKAMCVALEPVYEEMQGRIGKELIQAIRQEAGSIIEGKN
ncbi:TRAP transporter substrate-binding protein [Defluviicoccus vanus]|uniref:TRAP transporter substrate-binding protein n=1 Tax=Defluviicoccus vanus TaxID=111831 RepID=A0A7H1N5I0_9PROT|nr:TRAP transporter substrate-binding protein [Defluviicoccus vanus]QNT70966.1 TRAP transporter substrate-binding protein [Defluviicoccus vanus]